MITRLPEAPLSVEASPPLELTADLAALYVGQPSRRAAPAADRAAAAAERPAAARPLEPIVSRERSVPASFLPLCVMLTGVGFGVYLYLFVHGIPMACLVAALGLVGALFCRELLR
jgi:hypothetical protein